MSKILGSLIGLMVALAGVAAQATELRVLSSWDNSAPSRSILLETYLKNVEAASKGDITFRVSGPETVAAFEQLQPVSTGVFQMLFTHSAYHIGNTSFLLPVDGLKGSAEQMRAAGMIELIDRHYKRFGLKLVVLIKPPENTGYQIILRQPVGPSGDLKGRKIRGTQTYSGVFSFLGASPVVLPPNEIYTALEKGVVDGAAWPAAGVRDYRWNEVAKYLMRPRFGSAAYFLFVNLDAWNKLSDAQRTTLVEEGKKIETFWDAQWLTITGNEEKSLLAEGSQITQLGATQSAGLAAAFEHGLWELAAKTEPAGIAELREFAKQHGFSN